MSAVLDPMQQIEARRIERGMAIEQLVSASGLSRQHYGRLVRREYPAQRATLARLRTALSRLVGRPSDLALPETRAFVATYFSVLALVCERAGVATSDVHSHDPSRRATSDPAWLKAAQLRRQAIYLVNIALGIEQADIAKAVGLTPAAVSLACRAIEAEREDDGPLDRLLEELTRTITGDVG